MMVCPFTIIADDMTGANATGALFLQHGWPVRSIVRFDADVSHSTNRQEVLVWNSASRLLDGSAARERLRGMVTQWMRWTQCAKREAWPESKRHERGSSTAGPCNGAMIAKRIDSTLRGPIGWELQGMHDALPQQTVTVIVPAFPQSGRTCVDGHVLVHGVPVHLTEAGRDPSTPVHTSNVAELLGAQGISTAIHLSMDDIASDARFTAAMCEISQTRYPVIVCDAVTDKDIGLLAKRWVRTKLPVLPVDPGPFTAAYAAAIAPSHNETGRILVVCGSRMETASRQVDTLIEQLHPSVIALDLRLLCDPLQQSDYFQALDDHVATAFASHELVVVRTDAIFFAESPGSPPVDTPSEPQASQVSLPPTTTPVPSPMAPHATPLSARAIASWVVRALSRHRFDGIFLSGGEIAYSTLLAMGAESLSIQEEVIPLCVRSQIVGGPFEQMHLVTKGGAVGDDFAIIASIESLRRVSQNHQP